LLLKASTVSAPLDSAMTEVDNALKAPSNPERPVIASESNDCLLCGGCTGGDD